ATYAKLQELQKNLPRLSPITKPNSGHGATVLFAYNYALENGAHYIFQTDSDGQTIPAEFWQFWKNRNNYNAIIGLRNGREDGFSRKFVTKVLKLVLLCVFGLNIPDANTPFRLIKAEALKKYIVKIPENFKLSNIMLSVCLVTYQEKIKFIPITFRPRQGGVNSINLKKIIKIGIQAVKDFSRIKKEL
ncbi:MAG: glycosyltransferase family 2 protein, partial [Bacteroidales bacterium]|nr:glycosyltransferase family 2 protein [Bacteroidales bacterium]